MTFEDAKKLLSLPRVVGEHPEGGEPIVAQNGRYGPYITWGKETRSLEDEDQIFTIDLDGALALLAQPKQRGRRAAAGPLEGTRRGPRHQETVVVRTGRFGLYVTDGETNATLRLGRHARDDLARSRLRAARRTAKRRTVDSTAKGRQEAAKKATKKTTKKATKKSPAKKATGAAKRAAVAKGAKIQRRVDRGARTRTTSRARGLFVVFEGIDASGKSTQARRVAELRDAHFTFEPGDTPLGVDLRRWVLDATTPMTPVTEALLMLVGPFTPRAHRHRTDARRVVGRS